MKAANPYLIFDGNAEEAFTFYGSVLGVELDGVIRFRDMPGGDQMPDAARDRVAHVSIPLGASILMGSDTHDPSNPMPAGNNFFVHLDSENAGEADGVFTALAAGGKVEMPMQRTAWAERFGMCADRFGIQWMVSYTGDASFPAG